MSVILQLLFSLWQRHKRSCTTLLARGYVHYWKRKKNVFWFCCAYKFNVCI